MAGKKKGSPHHHKKKKKSKTPDDDDEEINKQDLKRFAGSSDEEEESDDNGKHGRYEKHYDSDSEGEPLVKKKETHLNLKESASKRKKKATVNDNGNSDSEDDEKDTEETDEYPLHADQDEGMEGDREHDSDDDDDDDDSDSDDDVDFQHSLQTTSPKQKHGAAGMADAMLKILGTAPSIKKQKTDNAIILSKTVTPLQKQQLAEKQAAKDAREKRRLKDSSKLPALHIPLSVATSLTITSGSNNNNSVSKELEQERLHRRVATRGVVALFNAVAQHQQQAKEAAEEPVQKRHPSGKVEVKKLTKHGFLDMIKNSAVAKSSSSQKDTSDEAVTDGKKTQAQASKWEALQDDYMLNPKKNWDQDDESSDDEEGAGDSPMAKQKQKENRGGRHSSKKRRLVAAS